MNRIEFLKRSVLGFGIIPMLPLFLKSLLSKPVYTATMFRRDLKIVDSFPNSDSPLINYIAELKITSPGAPEYKMFEYWHEHSG